MRASPGVGEAAEEAMWGKKGGKEEGWKEGER